MTVSQTTVDGLLNHRVKLEQPRDGYRVAVDTVLVAAAVPARAEDSVLDMGCGVGGILLCLAARVAKLTLYGIDIQAPLVDLCQKNFELNRFTGRFHIEQADATSEETRRLGIFDHVVMNPPYYDQARHDVSADPIKRLANAENGAGLTAWIQAAHDFLKTPGTLTLIHHGERKEEVLDQLKSLFGEIDIVHLLPKEDAPPKRIIVRARKIDHKRVRICRPFVLHHEGGGYTDKAEGVLRHAEGLSFQSP